MRKKFLVALAASLILANGTSVALASGGSDDTTDSSTTIPRTRDDSNLTESQKAAQRAAQQAQQAAQRAAQQAQQAAQRAAQQARQAAQRAAQQAQHDGIAKYRLELTKFLERREAINTAFMTAKVDAQRAFKVARQAATTAIARKTAEKAFKLAVDTAIETRNTALRVLGAPPTKPVKP